MTGDPYSYPIDISALAPAQRKALEDRLRAEGISAMWLGDRIEIDQAYEARVESLIAAVRSASPERPPTGMPVAPPMPGPPSAPPGSTVGTPPPATYGQPGSPYGQPAAPSGAPAYGGYGYPAYAPVTNSKATIALILGICAWAVCPVTAIPAVIYGRIAKREIEASNGAETGSGLATAGFILGLANLAVYGVLLVVFALAVIVGSTAGAS